MKNFIIYISCISLSVYDCLQKIIKTNTSEKKNFNVLVILFLAERGLIFDTFKGMHN